MNEKGANPTTENKYSKDFKMALEEICSDSDYKVLEYYFFRQAGKYKMKFENLK